MSTQRIAWGWGLATITSSGTVLDTWYPAPALGAAPEGAPDAPGALTLLVAEDPRRDVHTSIVRTEVDLDSAPGDTPDAYLRLHLLSHRLVEPNSINLDGMFGVLPNVVWTSAGPCAPEGFEAVRARLRVDCP